MSKGKFWKDDASGFLWLRWYVAGKILQVGAGLLFGAALAGVRLSGWFGAGVWLLSIVARLNARGIMKTGMRDVCSSCLADCPLCLARHAAGQASKVKIPGGGP